MIQARSWYAFGIVSLALCLTALSGCYRLDSPPKLGETIRVEFVGNDARLVRSQGYVTDAVAKALVQRLGWQVTPNGTAKLQLVLREERIEASAQDSRGITNSWSIRLDGTALLVARGGSITGTFTGLGNSTGLSTSQGEPEALQAAATQAADDLVSWLDINARPLVR
jgi:hypothetical protein